jgi:hypothetical protein
VTAIAGFTDGKTVWIGGDSASVAGLYLTVRANKKVFRVGDFLIGSAGSARMNQVIQYGWTPPTIEENQDLHEFMVTKFIDSLRERFKACGISKKKEEVESVEGTLLIGYRGRLFKIFSDFQVGIPLAHYEAAGCGDDMCNGAFFAMKSLTVDPAVQVEIALQAAEAHSGGVRGPFNILTLEG